jgi:hypothetical protein
VAAALHSKHVDVAHSIRRSEIALPISAGWWYRLIHPENENSGKFSSTVLKAHSAFFHSGLSAGRTSASLLRLAKTVGAY